MRPDLPGRAVPLPEASTLAYLSVPQRQLMPAPNSGALPLFNPECVLVKFKEQELVSVIRTETGREAEAVHLLARRSDVEFAELDLLQEPAFIPTDPLIGNQWHHQKIGSYGAWNHARGEASVRIAIVDAPFQMDHPDLALHVRPGWDIVANQPITASAGALHSTFSAGMAAAVVDNGVGVAGAGNCALVPINISGFTSEMCDAVYWAASNGIRVVNISWTGANSEALNAAGAFLRRNARGVLAMPGLNVPVFVDYPNQPDIWCVAMTDAADNTQSAYGNHIDFAAPGWQVYSTTTNSGYAFGSGTSYATPLFCGVAAVLFSVNPTLSGEEVIELLKSTAVDLGPPGWDMWYGWGRIDFAAAVNAAFATLPVITGVLQTNGHFTVVARFQPGLSYTLWQTAALVPSDWALVPNAVLVTNNNEIRLTDPSPPAGGRFYRLRVSMP